VSPMVEALPSIFVSWCYFSIPVTSIDAQAPHSAGARDTARGFTSGIFQMIFASACQNASSNTTVMLFRVQPAIDQGTHHVVSKISSISYQQV
jgi:hypothetical protein